MNINDYLRISEKYNECPKCGNGYIGNGQGKLIVEDDYMIRECKCGFKIKLNSQGEEMPYDERKV